MSASNRMRHAVALVLVVIVVAFAAPVRAEDGASSPPTSRFTGPNTMEAKIHLQRGNRHHNLREYTLAIEQYKSGIRLEQAPIFFYNLGQAYRMLKDYGNAIHYYKLYIRNERNSDSGVIAAIVERIKDMQRELDDGAHRQPPTGPAGAGAEKDGSAGKGAPGVARDDLMTKDVLSPTTLLTRRQRPVDLVGWGLAGGGLIVGLVGVGALVSASDLRSSAKSEERWNERESLADKADSRGNIGYVASILGGVTLVTGITKLLFFRPNMEEVSTERIEVVMSSRLIGVKGAF